MTTERSGRLRGIRELQAAHGIAARHPGGRRTNDLHALRGVRRRTEPPASGDPALQTKSGFLEDSYFKRTPWTFGGEYARLIVHDKRSVYYVRMFDTLRGLDPTVFFTPGRQGLPAVRQEHRAAAAARGRSGSRCGSGRWSSPRAGCSSPARPTSSTPKDPLGAFEGRKGGLLYVFDSASGREAGRARASVPARVQRRGRRRRAALPCRRGRQHHLLREGRRRAGEDP